MKRLKRIELYLDVLETYGYGHQVMKAIEESAELINALSKLKDNRTEFNDLITELADVAIMVEQMAVLFGLAEFEAEKEKKLIRLQERLNNLKNTNENEANRRSGSDIDDRSV